MTGVTDTSSPTLEQWFSTQPTILVGGINFTTWPDLKWSRACSHISALESRMQEWSASAPVTVEGVLRADHQGADFIARVPRGMPTHEWSLDLGDALHNLRSAFDAAAWGMAHFHGATPTHPKKVTFPICDTERKWNDAVNAWVGELQPDFQARLRLLQPFNYQSTSIFVLSLLHDLDIQDKHRDMLTVSADMHEVMLDGGIFEYEDPLVQANLAFEMGEGVKFTDGAVLGTLHAGATVRQAEPLVLRPTMRIQLTHNGETHEVLSLLHRLRDESRRYLDILFQGLARPEVDGSVDGAQDNMETVPPTSESLTTDH